MESLPAPRKRIRNRRRKRYLKNKRLDRERVKFEVRSAKRQKLIADCSVYVPKDKLPGKSMEATAFWENYTTAQQWQQTHNVVWWRTRCSALEQENQVLRETVRSLARSRQCQCQRPSQVLNKVPNELHNILPDPCHNMVQNGFQNEIPNGFSNVEHEEPDDETFSDDESIEFQLDEDMMKFLKQSIQHKMELKQQREEEERATEKEEEEEEVPLQGAAWMKERTENAKLLYGEASPRILGMETALQTTIDRHKDKTRAQYWPNIPLKL